MPNVHKEDSRPANRSNSEIRSDQILYNILKRLSLYHRHKPSLARAQSRLATLVRGTVKLPPARLHGCLFNRLTDKNVKGSKVKVTPMLEDDVGAVPGRPGRVYCNLRRQKPRHGVKHAGLCFVNNKRWRLGKGQSCGPLDA
jgi:hypothetical protein